MYSTWPSPTAIKQDILWENLSHPCDQKQLIDIFRDLSSVKTQSGAKQAHGFANDVTTYKELLCNNNKGKEGHLDRHVYFNRLDLLMYHGGAYYLLG
jgi:hypothetical protein